MLLKVKAGVPQKLDDGDNPTFEAWIQRVNNFLVRGTGLSAEDLPDCRWMDWYERRVRPIRAANKALKAAGAEAF